jgi:tRNA(fMet)-specific endonuclease VapC
VALLIDTSVLITWERRDLFAADLIKVLPNEPMGISSITASELLVGVHRANTTERRLKREGFVEAVFAQFPTMAFDHLAARVHAFVGASIAATGRPIGAHDLIIAATALANGYDLLTDNPREFDRVPGLVVRRPDW